MPIFAVPKDTVDLLVSAALMRRREPSPDAAKRLVHISDRIGQEIWDENHAALADDIERTNISAPLYHWQPVLEISGGSISRAQLLQVERCRRFMLAQCRPRAKGGAPRVHDLLERLGWAVSGRLHEIASGSAPVPMHDYPGMDATVAQWKRSNWPPIALPVRADGQSA